MKIFRSDLDALKRQSEIREEYPDYMDKAHALIVKCLKKNDEERLNIYLGTKDEYIEDRGMSVDRIFMYFSLRDLCRQMEKVDRENLHHLWTEHAWDWYIRRLFGLPFEIVESSKNPEHMVGHHSQEFLKSIIILP